jgi:hypothetical protein
MTAQTQPQTTPKTTAQTAAQTTSAPLNRAPLDRIARAVQRQQLAGADLAELRALIALLVALDTEHRIVRAGLRNLRVADTQLKDIQARNFGPILDETAFATLPKHLRRRVLLRLSNIAGRMDREAARRGPSKRLLPDLQPTVTDNDIDPAFKCVRDCRACEAVPDASAFWCQLSLVVCLLRTVLPVLASQGSPPSERSRADPGRLQ